MRGRDASGETAGSDRLDEPREAEEGGTPRSTKVSESNSQKKTTTDGRTDARSRIAEGGIRPPRGPPAAASDFDFASGFGRPRLRWTDDPSPGGVVPIADGACHGVRRNGDRARSADRVGFASRATDVPDGGPDDGRRIAPSGPPAAAPLRVRGRPSDARRLARADEGLPRGNRRIARRRLDAGLRPSGRIGRRRGRTRGPDRGGRRRRRPNEESEVDVRLSRSTLIR